MHNNLKYFKIELPPSSTSRGEVKSKQPSTYPAFQQLPNQYPTLKLKGMCL